MTHDHISVASRQEITVDREPDRVWAQ